MSQHTHQQVPTVGATILRTLRRHPDRVAFSWDGGEISYAGALDLIGRLQAALLARGLRRGDCLALLTGNRAETWCTAVAAWTSGIVVTYLHPLGSLSDQLFQLEDSGSAGLVFDAQRFGQRGADLIEGAAPLKFVGSLGETESTVDLLAAAEAVGARPARDVADANDVLWLNYSGGTTGRPKGSVYRHASVLSITRSILCDFELPTSPRYLAVAPITHVAGTKVLPVLARGGTVHLMDGFAPDRVLRTIERKRINMTLLVPTMIYALLDHDGLDGTDLSTLELLLYGAASMAQQRLEEGLERIGPVFAQLYGQSECYPIAYLPRGAHEDPGLRASCGYPVHGVGVALVSDGGAPVADGEAGEICVRSPSAMDGYLHLPELDAETLADGRLHTGDVGRLDDRGCLSIVDRKKDMIVTGGFNVYPREVEDALSEHPAVSSAAVYGLPDDRWGETVSAAVVLRPDVAVTQAELIAHVKERKGSVQAPKHLRFVDTLPTTAVGKVDKKALRRL